MDLYHEGYLDHLVKFGIVSPSIPSYIRIYLEFNECRGTGETYRNSVKRLAQRNRISETTIKKAIRLIQNVMGNQKVTHDKSTLERVIQNE